MSKLEAHQKVATVALALAIALAFDNTLVYFVTNCYYMVQMGTDSVCWSHRNAVNIEKGDPISL